MGRKKRQGAKPNTKTNEAGSPNPCRICRKPFTVSASGRLSWTALLNFAKRADLCSSCWLSEEAAQAAPKAASLALPELVGTPKRKQYGLIARQEYVEKALALLPDDAARKEFLARSAVQTDAKWWIENRNRERSRRPSAGAPRFDPALATEPVVEFDGGCTRNPGGLGTFGAVLRIAGQIKDAACGRSGRGETSNRAEYRGLIAGLNLALRHLPPDSSIHVVGDSNLVIHQMRDEWRVLDPGLYPLWQEAKRLATNFRTFSYHHLPRALNRDADHLARAARNGRTDAMEVLRKRPAESTAKPAPPPVSQPGNWLLAMAVGGQGVGRAVGAVLCHGNVEVASFSSLCGPGQRLPSLLRSLAEKALSAIAVLEPEGGSIDLLTVEHDMIGASPSFAGWTGQARRPLAGENQFFKRAKNLARDAVRATTAPSDASKVSARQPSGAPEIPQGQAAAAVGASESKGQRRKKKKRPQQNNKADLYPGADTVREFDRTRESDRKLGLPRLMYGTEKQHEKATNIRHGFIVEKLRAIEALGLRDSGELRDRLIGEVKKQGLSYWWLAEQDRLDQHFAGFLPPVPPALPSGISEGGAPPAAS